MGRDGEDPSRSTTSGLCQLSDNNVLSAVGTSGHVSRAIGSGRLSQVRVLVPVRLPLRESGLQTLRRAAERSNDLGDAHLIVLHVNLLHHGESVTQSELERRAASAVGSLTPASYHTRNSFFLEEAILDEAFDQDADYVFIGRSRRRRWRRLLSNRVGLSLDLESLLRRHLDAELVVV